MKAKLILVIGQDNGTDKDETAIQHC